ncbi:MAG: hypothetical protein RR101_14470 [Burkholderiaceae bacterium]
MNFEPFDTDLVIARLKEATSGFRLIAGAADAITVRDLRELNPPSAYVLLADEAGSSTGSRGAVAPAVARFGVAIAVRNYRAGSGEQVSAEARQRVGQVRAALIGWQPPLPGASPCSWLAGATFDYDDSTLVWVDTYQCTHVLQR